MKNLFKFLLLGAFTLSLGVGFVGCKNYDDDIKAICKDIEVLQGDVAKLRADLDAAMGGGKYVTNATLTGTDLVFTVSDNTSFKVDLSKLGGTPTNMPKLTGSDADGWVLSVWNATTSQYDEVKLPGAASAVSKIEILGWVTGQTDNSAALSLTDVAKTSATGDAFPIGYAYITAFQTETTATPAGTGGGAYTANTPAAWNADGTKGATKVEKTMVINTLKGVRTGLVVEVFPSSADLSAMTFTLENSKGELLPIKLDKAEKITGLLSVRAAASALWFVPGDYTADKYTAGAAGNEAINYTKLIDQTQNVGSSNATVSFALVAGGARLSEYTPFYFHAFAQTSAEGAVYGLKSTAANSTVTVPFFSGSTAATTAAAGTAGTRAADPIKIDANVEYAPYFTPMLQLGQASTDAVVDWYLDLPDNFISDQFQVVFNANHTAFTVKLQPDAVTPAPFNLNVYKLGVDGTVYYEVINLQPKNAVRLFEYTVPSYLVESVDPTDDGATAAGFPTANAAGKTAANGLLMGRTVVIDLDGMFTYLKGISTGNSTLYNKFVSTTGNIGADRLVITGISIDDNALTAAQAATFVAALDGAGGAIQGNTKADGTATGAGVLDITSNNANQAKSLVFLMPFAVADNAMGSGTTLVPGYTADAESTLADPAWLIGKKYTFTYDFQDGDHNYINTLKVNFTPTIPALSSLVQRQENLARWNGNVLNAFYRVPDTWADSGMSTRYDIAVGSYVVNNVGDTSTGPGNGAIENAGGDGGFAKLGGTFNVDKQWANVSLHPTENAGGTAYTQKFDDSSAPYFAFATASPATNSLEYALAVAESATNRIFELYWQNDATDASQLADGGSETVAISTAAQAAGVKDAYGVALNMELGDTKYLSLYNFKAEEYAAANFQIKIMSALAEGEILPAAGAAAITVPAATIGTAFVLDKSQIVGENYNDQVYNLFKKVAKTAAVNTAAYEYTYVRNVYFRVPSTYSTDYHIEGTGTIAADAGDTDTGTWCTELPVAAVSATADQWGYINVYADNTSQTVTDQLEVKVVDRFGRTIIRKVPITLTKQTTTR